MRVELFGNLRITNQQQIVTAVNTNRLQSLFAFLLLSGDAPQSREHLAFLLWPESDESQARTNLRQLLHHLRRALPAECSLLNTDNHTVRWRRDPSCTVDVVDFQAAVARADEAAKRHELEAEREALEEAARLYQDDLLCGLYDEWLQPQRDRLREQLRHILERLTALFEERGDFASAIRHAERLAAHDPLRESHHQALIRLYAANHDRASALRAYHQCMRVLRRELGVEPGAATREMFERILKSAPSETITGKTRRAAATSRLVGRHAEWERLQECWRTVSRQGPQRGTQLAVILGEPGIGKSRLAEELFDTCSDEAGSSARTRCYAGLGQIAYAPIADWLRAKPLRAARSRLSPSQLAELARVLPEILVENSAIQRPQRLTESWERLHFYGALNAVFGYAAKPLLLVIDDLQWCDADSIEWLHSLFRSPLAEGILVVGTARSEEVGRDHPLTGLLHELRRSGQAVELPLAPLDAEETAALARQAAGHPLADAELTGLYRSTRGNPLFVVESVRAGLSTPGSPDESAAPPRVHAVITARLAKLSAASAELAGLASTIGRSFSFDLLAKASDWDEDSLSRALEELWQRRIIESRAASDYDFTHDRLREVAYAELSPVRRRFLHRRVALALEELHQTGLESRSAQIAAHYEEAGMAEPAIRHYCAAAAIARQRYADAEAAGLLRRALALCREFPETAQRDQRELELLVALGPALVSTSGYAWPEAGETYSRALTLSRRLGESQHLYSVLSGSWLFNIVRGHLEKSRELGREYLDLANRQGMEPFMMAGRFLVGSSHFHLGLFAASRSYMEESLAGGAAGSDSMLAMFVGPDVGVFCRSYLAHVLWHLGFADQAETAINQGLDVAKLVAHPFSKVIALNYAAMLGVFRRDCQVALDRAEEAATLCRAHDFAYYLSMAEILAGWARNANGDAENGLSQLRQGLDALKATGAEVRLPFYYGLAAEACGRAGQTREALANISNAFAFQSKNGEVWASSELHRIHGDLVLASKNSAAAEACYRQALETAQQAGFPLLQVRAATRLCRLKGGEDRTLLEDLCRDLSEGFDTRDMQEARALLA